MKRAVTTLLLPLRHWPKTAATGLVLFVLLFVPVWPFFPHCDDGSYPGSVVFKYMSALYRSKVEYAFNQFGVYYWEIGGVLLLPAIPLFDKRRPVMNHGEAVHNAALQAASSLAKSDPPVDIEINGEIHRTPSFIRDLVKNHAGLRPYMRCDVMPYIVTMTPPPAKPAP
jgi:hypothetical protein